MRISVVVNNYNYGRFVGRAVQSALDQVPPPHEVVVVDDGSTDDSVAVLGEIVRRNPAVRLVAKQNGGQLSAFNAGFAASTGEVVCFLDADDEYLPGYLARLTQAYTSQPAIDFVYCTVEFVRDGALLHKSSEATQSFDHGISFFRTLALGEWVGSPTSALSARRRLLDKILPCPLEREWRIRADDVLVIGAAMAPGRKMHLAETFVRYHVHGGNSWFGAEHDPARLLRERLERHRLAGHFGRDVVASLAARRDWRRLVLAEFRTIPRPRFSDARVYARVITRVPGAWSWVWKLRVFKHWLFASSAANR
jgi:glycosyltransferase involved in cell wall biosynthesis